MPLFKKKIRRFRLKVGPVFETYRCQTLTQHRHMWLHSITSIFLNYYQYLDISVNVIVAACIRVSAP
jgi:hypothetical protein